MRTCVTCKQSMSEGYLLEELGDTFCSNKCLDEVFPGSSVEMENMTEEELDNSTWYWTTWEEEDRGEEEQHENIQNEVQANDYREWGNSIQQR